MARAMTTIMRSRLSTTSSTALLMVASAHHAGAGNVQFGEMGVRVRKIQFNCALCLAPTASKLRGRVFETIRQIDPRPVLLLRHRIENRLASRIDHSRNDKACGAGGHVDVEIDLRKDRLMHLGERRSKDL